MLSTVSKLEEPDKVEISNGIAKILAELDMSLDEFVDSIGKYNPKTRNVILNQIERLRV